MKIEFKNVSTVGPTAHSAFKTLPFGRMEMESRLLPEPLLALQTEDCIKILGGIRRFEAVSPVEVPVLPAYVLTEARTLDMIQAVIDFYAPMNLVEKALLLQACQELGLPEDDRINSILPLLDLPRKVQTLEELAFLTRLNPQLQYFIVEKDISLKRIRALQRCEEIMDWSVALMETFKPGVNVFLEILQNLWEISRRDELTLFELLEKLQLKKLRLADDIEPRQALSALRETVQRERFPTLEAAGKDLEEAVSQLGLPAGVDLSWDPQFEKRGLELRARLADENDATELSKVLSSESFAGLFQRI